MVHLEPRPAPEIDTLALALGGLERRPPPRGRAGPQPSRMRATRRRQECRWARHRHCRPRACPARDLSLRPHWFAGTTDGAPLNALSICSMSPVLLLQVALVWAIHAGNHPALWLASGALVSREARVPVPRPQARP